MLVSFSGCSGHITPGKGRGDITNLYYEDGRLFISKEPYFVLYMNPDDNSSVEGVFELNGIVEHFYVVELYSCVTSKVVALAKEYATDIRPYKQNDNVYMYCDFVHKSNGEVVEILEYESGHHTGEEIFLELAPISLSKAKALFEKCKKLPKDQIPELAY